jgi:hypothetical protein
MSSWKCMNCGIVNFATADVCRRCQSPAAGGNPANPYAQANFQQQNPPGNYTANPVTPQANYQTGNLPQAGQQPTANPYARTMVIPKQATPTAVRNL